LLSGGCTCIGKIDGYAHLCLDARLGATLGYAGNHNGKAGRKKIEVYRESKSDKKKHTLSKTLLEDILQSERQKDSFFVVVKLEVVLV